MSLTQAVARQSQGLHTLNSTRVSYFTKDTQAFHLLSRTQSTNLQNNLTTMSIRAYRIIEIKHETDSSFNWSHESEWLECVEGFFVDTEKTESNHGDSILSIDLENADEVREWVNTHNISESEIQESETVEDVREYRKKIVKQIIDDIQASEYGTVQYLLY